MSAIARNLAVVNDRIAAAAARAGRSRDDILLVAVTKTVPSGRVNEAISAGVGAIGENRVQEARAKWPGLRGDVEKHLIGRLQRNKVSRAVELFDWIESVDRIELAEEISKRAVAVGKVMPVLVEVNSSGETSKAGVSPKEAGALIERAALLPGIRVEGLMTIGPLTPDEEAVRLAFRETRRLFDRLRDEPPRGAEMNRLSMGMSGDFEIAVEEGAHIVRIGSAIFGDRS